MINKPQNYYPDTFRQVEGKDKNALSKFNKKEPFHELNREVLYTILLNSKKPLSCRELQVELKKQYDRKADLGTLYAPIIYLEKEARVSWIKMKSKFTKNQVKHYFVTSEDLPIGSFKDFDIETQKFVIRKGYANV